MAAYYNEIEPFAAEWIHNLISKGLIADGEVDTRSIVDVRPADLAGFDQCHFFAGIGGWSYALRSAGWDDDRPVWTGSCPCQPFSLAGKQKGFDDARHLWPVWRELIRECDPAVVFGEQVASAGKWPGDLQRMRDREAIERVLQGQSFGDGPAIDMQGLLEDEARRASEEEQGADPMHLGQAEGWPQGAGIRSGSAHQRTAVGYRGGDLPIDWGSVQPGRRLDVGQSVAGSDRLEEWVPDQQRQSGALLGERDGQPLGAEQDHRNRPGDKSAEVVAVGRSADEVGSSAAQESNWLRSVRSDLEAMGRAVGAMPIQAASAGADHLRDRYWFVAHTDDARPQGWRLLPERAGERPAGADGVADADQLGTGEERSERGRQLGGTGGDPQACAGGDVADGYGQRGQVDQDARGCADGDRSREVAGLGCACDVADASCGRCSGSGEGQGEQPWRTETERSGDLDWVIGADGKARRVKSGLRLLAHGVSGRVGKLRGFGNAIDPRPAAAFIEAADHAMRAS